jgi:D-3-phosphoglycerate dehydrogenase / 2-oxoglutarate reductase
MPADWIIAVPSPIVLCSDVECRFTECDLTRLAEVASVEVSVDYRLSTLLPQIGNADVLVVSCFAQVPAELIKAGHRLRGIVKYGVGVDNIDLQAARDQGLPVANCPDYGSGTVADHAFALLMALARRIVLQDTRLRQGWYWPDENLCGVDLEGKVLGIIGLGRIGRKMARRAVGYDMEVIAHDPYVNTNVLAAQTPQPRFVTLDELLSSSDFVSVHCTLTPETRGLIGERELRKMKSSAYLINVSRGEIVDQTTLIRGLLEGWLAGAGLDVFAAEPILNEAPILSIPNVVITPHLAWYTWEAAARQSQQAADAALDILAGRRPRSVVNAHTNA